MSLVAEQLNESELAWVSIFSGMDVHSPSCCLCKALKQHKAKLGVPTAPMLSGAQLLASNLLPAPWVSQKDPGCMADKGLQALIRAASACTAAPDKSSGLKRWTLVCCGT